MDLTLLSAPVSEYNKQRTGAHFTVQPANSPSYSLNRRPGIRKSRTLYQEESESTGEVGNTERLRIRTRTNGTSEDDHSVTGHQTRTAGYSSVKGQCEESEMSDHKMSTKLNHNGAADKTSTEFGTDRSVNSKFASESRGRTEWRRNNLTSRSKSLDWRTGAKSPDRGTRAHMLSSKQGGDINKQAGGFEERLAGNESVRSRVMSSVQAYNFAGTSNVFQDRSPESHMGQTLDRASRGHSLPSRLRSQAKDIATSFGPKGSESILERIEKLYGSSGLSKTEDSGKIRDFSTSVRDWPLSEETEQALISHQRGSSGGTFPRRFSSEREKYNLSPGQSGASFTCIPQKDANTSSSDTSPGTSRTRVTSGSGGGQSQRQISSRHFEEGSVYQGRGLVEFGTRSLDRARSKYTIAAKLRAARAAEEMTAPVQSNTFLKEISEVSVRDPAGSRARGTNGSKEKDWANHGEEKNETDGISGALRERSMSKMDQTKEQKQEKRADSGLKEKREREETELKISRTDEDVFESNPQTIRLKTVEKKPFTDKLSAPTAANVRNKINQFEALTQRAQGLATGQVLMPRRTFSVPTQLSRAYDGEKKSGSAKAIGERKDRWEGLREGEEAADKKKEKTTKKFGSQRVPRETKTENPEQDKRVQRGLNLRSVSVDEVGLRLANKERQSNDVQEKIEKNINSDNKCSEDFGKYSRLKKTLDIPLHGAAQTQNPVNFYMDETDFSKVSSPEESDKKLTTDNTPSNFGDTSTGLLQSSESSALQKVTFSGVDTPVSDDDKTPTNTPINSPFLSPDSQQQNSTPIAEDEDEDSSVFTQSAKTPDPDSTPISPPLATSSYSNVPDLMSPDVNKVHPKGMKRVLDLDAWVAGLTPQFKGWNDDEDDDDDESTQKDEDSNYDSDSGESSVTITSHMSQSDHRSFSVSLSDLCNFAGMDYESENDSDEWQSTGRRSASLSSDVSALSCVSVMPSEELDRLIEDVKGLGDNALQGYEDVQVVVLHKDVGVGLGFSMAGGVDQNKPVTVHKVFHSGVAAQEGSIREGDQVLSINGTALGGYAHWEALRVLRRAKSREMGVVVLKRGGISAVLKGSVFMDHQEPTLTRVTETGQCLCVQLEKNNRDLGFSLEGGVGSSLGNKPLTVQKIFQGGPVDKVCPGDEVLEIKGLSMVGMRRLEAWTLIRKLPPGPVNVVLRRSPKHSDT